MKMGTFVRQLQASRTVARVAALERAPSVAAGHLLDTDLQRPLVARGPLPLQPQRPVLRHSLVEHEHLESAHHHQKLLEPDTHQRKQEHLQQEKHEYERDTLDLSFNNTQTAYKSKTNRQLWRNYLVLGLCSSDYLVKNNDRLMRVSRAILGRRLFEQLMRSTFYGQFVAGVDEREIVPTIKHLSSFGVKTILDYSAEEDVREEPAQSQQHQQQVSNAESRYLAGAGNCSSQLSSMRRYQNSEGDFEGGRKYLPVARTYFYRDEAQCERNLEIFFKAIEAVAQTTGNTGFAAIKLTALGRPQLLMKLSKIIDYMREQEQQQVAASGFGMWQRPAGSLKELLARFNSLKQRHIEPLDEDEEEMLFNLMRRVNRIAAYASQVGGARCMIDAEQTYMQPAINMIAMELMRKYNRREPIIFNTYQCYLKGAFEHVKRDLASSRADNFFFGAKLVRGAYMDQERERARKLGYEDPINESFEATTDMYHKTLGYLMNEIERELKYEQAGGSGKQVVQNRRISIMVATHNENAVMYTLELMKRHGIKPEHRAICFGQLYGMCDHISFSLGQSGYSVYKYTPYGPIEEVLPYLGRRAIENHGFLDKLNRERSLLKQEIWRRLLAGQWFYKPMGNYKHA